MTVSFFWNGNHSRHPAKADLSPRDTHSNKARNQNNSLEQDTHNAFSTGLSFVIYFVVATFLSTPTVAQEAEADTSGIVRLIVQILGDAQPPDSEWIPVTFTRSPGSEITLSGLENGSFLHAIAVLDLNGDGFDDVLVNGPKWTNTGFVNETTTPLTFINNGNNELVPGDISNLVDIAPQIVHARFAKVADFNGDGAQDVVIAAYGHDQPPFPGESNVLLLSQANGSYVNAGIGDADFSYMGGTHSLSVGDIDGDSDIDIVFVDIGGIDSNCTERVRVLVNDGQANFETRTDNIPDSYANTCPDWTGSDLADLNNDNRLDLVLSGGSPAHDSIILWNSGAGIFSDVSVSSPTILPSVNDFTTRPTVKAVDLNNDGYLDLLQSGTRTTPSYSGRHIQALTNNWDRTFSDSTNTYFSTQDTALSWIQDFFITDLNNDGRIDIVPSLGTGDIDRTEYQYIYMRQPDRSYTAINNQSLPAIGGLIPIDIDNDDDSDLLVFAHDRFGDGQSMTWVLLINSTQP